MTHGGSPDASLATLSRCIRRRSTTRPEPSSPTTLQLFLPRSIPRTAISMPASFPLAPAGLRCQVGGAANPIKFGRISEALARRLGFDPADIEVWFGDQ